MSQPHHSPDSDDPDRSSRWAPSPSMEEDDSISATELEPGQGDTTGGSPTAPKQLHLTEEPATSWPNATLPPENPQQSDLDAASPTTATSASMSFLRHEADDEEEEDGSGSGGGVGGGIASSSVASSPLPSSEEDGEIVEGGDDDDDEPEEEEGGLQEPSAVADETASDEATPNIMDAEEEEQEEEDCGGDIPNDEINHTNGPEEEEDEEMEEAEQMQHDQEQLEKGKDDEDDEEQDENSKKPSYSTRGRTINLQQQQDPPGTSTGNNSALDRLAAVGDFLASTSTSTTALVNNDPFHAVATTEITTGRMRESFLSDSLTEEERRTRTRYLPEVDGMRALRKTEVKNDLALARLDTTSSSNGSSGNTNNNTAKSKSNSNASKRGGKQQQRDEYSSDSGGAVPMSTNEEKNVYDTETGEPLDGVDDPRHIRRMEVGQMHLVIPSPAFVAPSESTNSSVHNKPPRPSPAHVEAVTAFNPPRPPESIGAKKKHRMLRWERRPADIDVDLANYRKTVQRTRDEWMNAVEERERIVVTDNLVRRHFLHHWHCLSRETKKVSVEATSVAHACLERIEKEHEWLLPSNANRTRTRGALRQSSNTTVVKDVLYALRALGKEMETRGVEFSPSRSFESNANKHPPKKNFLGVGGVSAVSFVDWNSTTKIGTSSLASAWIVPGDTVQTPEGPGTVISVYGPGQESLHLQADSVFPLSKSPSQDTTETKAATAHHHKADAHDASSSSSFAMMVGPRVSVQFPLSGSVKVFALDKVQLNQEDPATYSDERLAQRWKSLAETARAVGSTLDVAAMATSVSCTSRDRSRIKQKFVGDNLPAAMDRDEAASRNTNSTNSNDATELNNDTAAQPQRLLPFGAGLLPTAAGRGTRIHQATLAELDAEMEKAFSKSNFAVLGKRDSAGVPLVVREREDERERHVELQAQVLQLRNQLLRQRRIRILNERTHTATQERASRVEALVSEMRTDLKNLKSRLDQEIRDLGIGEEEAEDILKSFYMSLDSQHQGEASPPKRARRLSRTEEGGFETNEDEEEGVSGVVDFPKGATPVEGMPAS